jgi:hypothetical protein
VHQLKDGLKGVSFAILSCCHLCVDQVVAMSENEDAYIDLTPRFLAMPKLGLLLWRLITEWELINSLL